MCKLRNFGMLLTWILEQTFQNIFEIIYFKHFWQKCYIFWTVVPKFNLRTVLECPLIFFNLFICILIQLLLILAFSWAHALISNWFHWVFTCVCLKLNNCSLAFSDFYSLNKWKCDVTHKLTESKRNFLTLGRPWFHHAKLLNFLKFAVRYLSHVLNMKNY